MPLNNSHCSSFARERGARREEEEAREAGEVEGEEEVGEGEEEMGEKEGEERCLKLWRGMVGRWCRSL